MVASSAVKSSSYSKNPTQADAVYMEHLINIRDGLASRETITRDLTNERRTNALELLQAYQDNGLAGFEKGYKALLKDDKLLHLWAKQIIRESPVVYRLCDLQSEILPEQSWAIPDVLPEGLTLLCGKPKLGKSWLLLSLLLSVAHGGAALGNIPVEQGEVLYISLEDNKRRLQKRANIVMRNKHASGNFYYQTTWPRLDQGGIEMLDVWISHHPQVRMIGIDTWAKIKSRGSGQRGKQQYDEDYDALTPLQELASKHGIAIVVVHHFRKLDGDDPIDAISGSTAMTGAVDNFLLLYRKRGEDDARLQVTGRDIEDEEEFLLTFDRECASWILKGNVDEVASTPERQALLDVVKKYPDGIAVKELANELGGKNINTTRNLLAALRTEGKIQLKGKYYSVIPSKSSNYSNHSNHSNHSKLSVEDTTTYYGNDQLTRSYYDNGDNHSNPVTPLDEPVQAIQDNSPVKVTRLTTKTIENTVVSKSPTNESEIPDYILDALDSIPLDDEWRD